MKIAGAILLLCAFVFAGSCVVKEKRSRIRSLRDLCCALEIMEGELSLRDSALPELCSYLSVHAAGEAQRLFSTLLGMLPLLGEQSFSSLWDKASAGCSGALRERDRDSLHSLGAVLGRYDVEIQLRQLRTCKSIFQKSREEAEYNYPMERRLWLGLCSSAGALFAILLL